MSAPLKKPRSSLRRLRRWGLKIDTGVAGCGVSAISCRLAERPMPATEVPLKKYVVRLSAEEREQPRALIRKGKNSRNS
jgi:hypothetical protein